MQAYNKQKIQQIVDVYERMYPTGPDSIAWCMVEAKNEQRELMLERRISKSGIIMKSESGRRQLFTMPSGLYLMLRKADPEIFKTHLKYLKRDFPVFFKAWQI